MTSILFRRCLVSGRVQGVFFRGSTQQKAKELGVTGHARNLPDGRVEVLAVGDGAAVQALMDWLRVGPPAARVDAVESIALESAGSVIPERFDVG